MWRCPIEIKMKPGTENSRTNITRTYRFAVLGMSLSNLFDIQNASDLLKSLLNILNEYEQSKEETYKPKMVRHKALGIHDTWILTKLRDQYSDPRKHPNDKSGVWMTIQCPFLTLQRLPFSWHLTWYLSSFPTSMTTDVYTSPSPSTTTKPFSPFSTFFRKSTTKSTNCLDHHPSLIPTNTWWAHWASFPLTLESHTYFRTHITQKETEVCGELRTGISWRMLRMWVDWWAPRQHGHQRLGKWCWTLIRNSKSVTFFTVREFVFKFLPQKIISVLLKDLDKFARNSIKDELATLGPSLRGQGVQDIGREQYDFEL